MRGTIKEVIFRWSKRHIHHPQLIYRTMNPIEGQQLLAQLNWRYATKQFDPSRKITPEDWAILEQALLLTPSSGGLQPWKFLVITDPEVLASLVPISYGQTQVGEASHLLVITTKNHFSEADVDAHLENLAQVQGVPVEALAPFRAILVGGIIQAMDESARNIWTRNQAYIALGNFLTNAALLGIDACPMEGFDRAQYDSVLGLTEKGVSSAVIVAAGYRATTDKYASAPKARFPKEQVFLSL
jgi:nitroreductase